jgi:uncharacterized protein YabE (DUF348 family)
MKIFKRFKKRAKKYRKGAKSFRWHHPFVILATTFMVLFFAGTLAFIGFSGETVGAPDTKVVKLTVDGQERTVPTRAHTVADLLDKLGIKLTKNDAIDPSPKTPIVGEDFRIELRYARPYVIVDENGKRQYATVAGVDLHDAANKAGAELYIEDIVYAEPTGANDTVSDGFVGTKLIIDRATPVVLSLYGKSIVVRSHATTVGGVLKDKGVVLRKGDRVRPKEDAKIKPNLPIFILRKGEKIVSVEKPIPPPVETREDPEAPVGSETIIEPGKPGTRLVTYRIKSKDGEEVGRKKIQSIVITQPKKRIVVVGTKAQGFDGGFEGALAALRGCEGSYSSNTGNGYYGAYQFSSSSWRSFAPAGYQDYWDSGRIPPPIAQDQAARNYYEVSGWSPWPACSQILGLPDVYR